MTWSSFWERAKDLLSLIIVIVVTACIVMFVWNAPRLITSFMEVVHQPGQYQREQCEDFCTEADSVLVELEGQPGGAVTCHCVVSDSE